MKAGEGLGALRPLNETFLCGRPFYCTACGVGLGEWLECDSEACSLESDVVAEARLRAAHVLIALNKRPDAIGGVES